MKPELKAPGTKRLKLKCDILLSTHAFSCNLRRYKLVDLTKSNPFFRRLEPSVQYEICKKCKAVRLGVDELVAGAETRPHFGSTCALSVGQGCT
jgi:hypothetical protein